MAQLASLLLSYLYQGNYRRIFMRTPCLRLLHPQCFRFRAQHHHHRPHVVAPWQVSWRNVAKLARCQMSLAIYSHIKLEPGP